MLAILFFMILISQNILLLNEETLILICFVTFCWLVVQKLSFLVKKDLDIKSYKIKKTVQKSLVDVSSSLETTLSIQDKFWALFHNFKLLGNFCSKFVNLVTDWSVRHTIKFNRIPFSKRLQFIIRIENQTTKLISLLLIRKLHKIAELKQFYRSKLSNPYFMCSYKINIREYIQAIYRT